MFSKLALFTLFISVNAFPSYSDGIIGREAQRLHPKPYDPSKAQAPPRVKDLTSRLVYDKHHPYLPPKKTDQRGPCPGLNTLANHGYISRSGVDTPQNIATAVQKAFNMEYNLAVATTWSAFLVDGNLVSGLLSIGGKTLATGPPPPAPATAGGLNTHALFEGDASYTRADTYFGDNHSFNETLFDRLNATCQQHSDGNYDFACAAEVRWNRIQDSTAHNPNFTFTTPRYLSAYAESIFPIRFFVDGRKGQDDPKVDMITMRSFFEANRMPEDFHRRNGSYGNLDIINDFPLVAGSHFIQPGVGINGTYVEDENDLGIKEPCFAYNTAIKTIAGLYPPEKVTGALRAAVKANVDTLNEISAPCPPLTPWGQ